MKVPFLDLKSAYLELQDEINVSISRILSGGVYVLGDEVESFESKLLITSCSKAQSLTFCAIGPA